MKNQTDRLSGGSVSTKKEGDLPRQTQARKEQLSSALRRNLQRRREAARRRDGASA